MSRYKVLMQKKTVRKPWEVGSRLTAAPEQYSGAEKLRAVQREGKGGRAWLLGPPPGLPLPVAPQPLSGGAAAFGFLLLLVPGIQLWLQSPTKIPEISGTPAGSSPTFPLLGRAGKPMRVHRSGTRARVRSRGVLLSLLPAPKAHKEEGCHRAWGP